MTSNFYSAKQQLPKFTGFGIPFVDVIVLDLSKGARQILIQMIKERNYMTNEVSVFISGSSAKSSFSRAFTELKKHNIVKRIKKQTYLLNPHAITVGQAYFKTVKRNWEETT